MKKSTNMLLGVLVIVSVWMYSDNAVSTKPVVKPQLPEFHLSSMITPGNHLNKADLAGQPYLLNFFASWCGICVREHQILKTIADQQLLPLYGVVLRDNPDTILKMLERYGNPYTEILQDDNSTFAASLGVRGIPDLYLIGPNGEILYRHIGLLTKRKFVKDILPLINKTR